MCSLIWVISEPPLKMKLKKKNIISLNFRTFLSWWMILFLYFPRQKKEKQKKWEKHKEKNLNRGLNYWLECEAGQLGHFISFSNKEGQKQPGKSGKANDGCRWRGLRWDWSEVPGGKFLNGMRDMCQKHSCFVFFLDNLIPNSLHSQLSIYH